MICDDLCLYLFETVEENTILRQIDISSGEELSSVSYIGKMVCDPVLIDDLIYMSFGSNTIVSIDKLNGEIAESITLGPKIILRLYSYQNRVSSLVKIPLFVKNKQIEKFSIVHIGENSTQTQEIGHPHDLLFGKHTNVISDGYVSVFSREGEKLQSLETDSNRFIAEIHDSLILNSSSVMEIMRNEYRYRILMDHAICRPVVLGGYVYWFSKNKLETVNIYTRKISFLADHQIQYRFDPFVANDSVFIVDGHGTVTKITGNTIEEHKTDKCILISRSMCLNTKNAFFYNGLSVWKHPL